MTVALFMAVAVMGLFGFALVAVRWDTRLVSIFLAGMAAVVVLPVGNQCRNLGDILPSFG